MLPPAPLRFSTTTLCPSRALRRSPRMRAKLSAYPPAGKATTRVMVRVGNSCAAAGPPASMASAKASAVRRPWARDRRSDPIDRTRRRRPADIAPAPCPVAIGATLAPALRPLQRARSSRPDAALQLRRARGGERDQRGAPAGTGQDLLRV